MMEDHVEPENPAIPCSAPVQSARYKLTAGEEEALQKMMKQELPIVVSKSTVSRRGTVRRLVEGARSLVPTVTPIRLMYLINSLYAPGSTMTFINTMASLYKDMKHFPEWSDHWKALSLAARKAGSKQAKVLTIEDMKELLEVWGDRMERPHYTVLFCWLTGSRFGDLRHMKWERNAERFIEGHQLTVGVVCLMGSKGDPSGKRGDRKAVVLPKAWSGHIVEQCVRDEKKTISRHHFKKALRTINPELSLHSCRRGACHALGVLNVTKLEAQQLALHNQVEQKESAAMNVYQTGLYLSDKRDILQIKLQLKLLEEIGIISASTTQYVCQEWLPRVNSKFRGTNKEQTTKHQEPCQRSVYEGRRGCSSESPAE